VLDVVQPPDDGVEVTTYLATAGPDVGGDHVSETSALLAVATMFCGACGGIGTVTVALCFFCAVTTTLFVETIVAFVDRFLGGVFFNVVVLVTVVTVVTVILGEASAEEVPGRLDELVTLGW
jgi:hypothetical protein